jgi:hypothetical protein
MKAMHLLLALTLSVALPVKAEERARERVYVYTDKDCYLVGEEVFVKFCAVDRGFQPSGLSKVGYVEICDTEKPLIQLKVALENGSGAGKMTLPDLPSGLYRLSGYTRYMRNEGEAVFFQKQIAIVNAEQQLADPKRFKVIDREAVAPKAKEPAVDWIRTDRTVYGNRQKVVLTIDPLPENVADWVVSVRRNDSIAWAPEVDNQQWMRQVADTFPFSQKWLPEYEGHIITGRVVPEPGEDLLASAAFVGSGLHYFVGPVAPDGTVRFHTAGVFGRQQLVTSVVSPNYYEEVPYSIELLSPFAEFLPDTLPVLSIFPNEKQLTERYVGVRIQRELRDSLPDPAAGLPEAGFQPVLSYKLDEYTRFATVGETILEYVSKVRVAKIRGKRRISVDLDETQRFSPRTLVLLDGVPIYDHEAILNYNPMNIKQLNIYDERFLFGGRDFEGIASFVTHRGGLPFFRLGNESRLSDYDCPQPFSPFIAPENQFPTPDFRHTIYWNPFVKAATNQAVSLTFFTSDLCGEFRVIVEGIGADGGRVRGILGFWVGE